MRTYLTIYIPELNILDTISKEIIINTTKPFKINNKTDEYFKVEPYIYTSSGSIATAISETQLNNIDNYEYDITNNFELISNILENDFKISSHFLDQIVIIVAYTGDCNKYIGEEIAVTKMKKYAEKLRNICENKLSDVEYYE